MNQREIKFRVWNPHSKDMSTKFNAMRFDGTLLSAASDDVYLETNLALTNEVVMQYTGLLDNQGKEIYSDDYVEDVAGGILCVFWGSGKYILQNISSGDIIDCNETNTQNKEVVGNRFETPREHKAMASDL